MSALPTLLQGRLQRRYDVDPRCVVDDFLTTDRLALPAAVEATGTDEQLLVRCEPESLAVTVFIDAGVLDRLAAVDPLHRLHGGNIADFWTVLEGVSHFLCLAWNALHDRLVSRLELELQAEIDKFVLTADLLREQGAVRFPAELHSLLFRRARVDATLAAGREQLYRAASDHAARFCATLERQTRRAVARPVIDLRRFYRLTELAKVQYIRSR